MFAYILPNLLFFEEFQNPFSQYLILKLKKKSIITNKKGFNISEM